MKAKKCGGPVINESQLTKEALLPSEPKIEETNGSPGPLDSSGPSMYAFKAKIRSGHMPYCRVQVSRPTILQQDTKDI